MVTEVRRYDVHLVNLDPTRGGEIRKTRPCVVVSPDETNRHLRTAIIAPMTTTRRRYPTRVDVTFQRKRGEVALDQIRAVDQSRLGRRLGRLPEHRGREISGTLLAMFAFE